MLRGLLVKGGRRWRYLVLISTPIVLSPLITNVGTQEAKCAFAVLLVAIYWMTTAVPLAVTSLLPMVLFPLLGVLPADRVSTNYMKESNMMLMSGIMAAIAIENCQLHRRIALKILLVVGTSPKWLMLGFMGTTAFLSMWINNTSAASMMVTIAISILQEMHADPAAAESSKNHIYSITSNTSQTTLVDEEIAETPFNNSNHKSVEDVEKATPTSVATQSTAVASAAAAEEQENQRKCILLSVAYAANLGGTGTITGTGTNLVFMEYMTTFYKGNTGITYATWMLFNVPAMLFALLLAWLWLQIVFLGPKALWKGVEPEKSKRIKGVIVRQYNELGAITFHEGVVAGLFVTLVLLWVFRKPEFMPGWETLFPAGGIKDSVAGIAIVFLLFAFPSKPDGLCLGSDYPPPRALTWSVVQAKMPWGVLLLMGGGFALADGSKASGLSTWLGRQLTLLKDLPPAATVTVIALMTAVLTEVTSNTATATILLPVLADMAQGIQVHPIYLMLPATVACSYAFMLPIATPPNAIVYEVSKMSSWDMVKPGLVMNILCVGVVIFMINTLGVAIFDLNEYPAWANTSNRTII